LETLQFLADYGHTSLYAFWKRGALFEELAILL
jgi:hypothetical protein